jgi:serine/threonine-protein kinase
VCALAGEPQENRVKDASFGKYRMLAELGQGGMADVILALSQGPVGFNKLVVIKRLRNHLAEDPEFVGMLLDEARLAAHLNHPNIVHTHEVGEVDGHFFMAMEFLDGQPLGRIRRRSWRAARPLPLPTEARIIADVLAGLHYAHELTDYEGASLSIVHRDVTPSNVFVTFEGAVKVLDFGIAKATGRTTETQTGVIKGKTPYMAPEHAMGMEVDRRADIFSAGVMLWEAATGQRMWRGMEPIVILTRLITGDIPVSPREVNPDVPEAMDAICRKALCREPDGRFATALEFQNELEAYLQTCGERTSRRELGRLVSELFTNERQEIKRVIDSQLAKESSKSSLTPFALTDSVPVSAPPAAGDFRDEPLTAVSNLTRSSRRRRRTSMLGVAAVLSAGAAIWLWSPSESPDAPPPAVIQGTASSVSSTPAVATGAPRKFGKLTLRAQPNSAQFSIDGGPWLDNPHVADVGLDGAEHTVVTRAKGYLDKKTTVMFDRDVNVEVSLRRSPGIVRGRPAPPPPAKSQPKPPPRELIGGDPWKDG